MHGASRKRHFLPEQNDEKEFADDPEKDSEA